MMVKLLMEKLRKCVYAITYSYKFITYLCKFIFHKNIVNVNLKKKFNEQGNQCT